MELSDLVRTPVTPLEKALAGLSSCDFDILTTTQDNRMSGHSRMTWLADLKRERAVWCEIIVKLGGVVPIEAPRSTTSKGTGGSEPPPGGDPPKEPVRV